MNQSGRELPLRRVFPKWGHGSRTEADRAIRASRVRVNGEIILDGDRIVDLERDRIELDGVALAPRPRLYLMMNKPRGVVTTMRDPEGRRTVSDLLPEAWRGAKPVGRLDRDSSGLLLLTTDGDLHFSITGPDSCVEKTYRVEIAGAARDEDFEPLRRGIELDGETLAPAVVRIVAASARTTHLEIVLIEGRFRQIRRSLQRVGHRVVTLHRVAIGSLRIGALPEGETIEIPAIELAELRACATPPKKTSRDSEIS